MKQTDVLAKPFNLPVLYSLTFPYSFISYSLVSVALVSLNSCALLILSECADSFHLSCFYVEIS